MTLALSLHPDIPVLDRRAEARLDPDWLRTAWLDPATRFVVSRGAQHLVRREPSTQIALLTRQHPDVAALIEDLPDSRLTLLGWFKGLRLVSIDLPEHHPFEVEGTSYEELRPLLGELPAGEADVLGFARALVFWRARHRHCGVCGAPTAPRSAGHVLRCTSEICGTDFFPRIDPAIIVLVTDGEYALLGRQKSWPPGRYSTLAGFVEVGETLEETVEREVGEETGTRVTWVKYVSSQPWPFPSSLMLGFRAGAVRGPVEMLDGELEDARWFDRRQIQSGQELALPPHHTIARQLIEAWLGERSH
jgi:NAD+ diphosphatase